MDGDWLEHLYSQNPKVAEEAARQLTELGAARAGDPAGRCRTRLRTSRRRRRRSRPAACSARCRARGRDVAEHLPDPELTAEAAVALSFMGREAYAPLREAASSDDPVVRREALRSIGKLKERAPLDAKAVVPLLLEALPIPSQACATVAATYLGIIHEEPRTAVPALIEALKDEEPAVRRPRPRRSDPSHRAGRQSAHPALRKAAGDRNEDVAREAGVALVKLQSSERK